MEGLLRFKVKQFVFSKKNIANQVKVLAPSRLQPPSFDLTLGDVEESGGRAIGLEWA